MTIELALAPETEARLRERAAETGKDLPTIVREAVEEKLAIEPNSPPPLTHEQWVREFDAWIASHKPTVHFVDDSRESIY